MYAEQRIQTLCERLARENRRLLALLRAGHSLREADRVLRRGRPVGVRKGRK